MLWMYICSKPTRQQLMLLFHFLTIVYVIKFQKRGLPHAYILLWLEEYYRCNAAIDIDDIILAELPSPTADIAGYKAMSDYMLHGPCGKDNRAVACNIEGKCSKHFLKPFYAETVIDQDGYPIYRRRDDKVCIKRYKKCLLFKYPELQLTMEQIQNYCLMIQHQQLYPQLNPEQRLIYEEAVDSIHNKKGQFHFVYGPWGTGKTFLYKTIISRLRSELKIVLTVASLGIASLLLPRLLIAGMYQPLRTMETLQGFNIETKYEVNEYNSNGNIDTQKQAFNQLVLAVGDGKVPARIKDGQDEPTWIEIPETFLIP
uniref:ATP-dependent DNA helicase n=1 Tax=Tanacetum cinerariifolium TaxID=118510 RepID=A0A6L2K382_TANCI|nr:helicase [Tanacetum cinerariifolium]